MRSVTRPDLPRRLAELRDGLRAQLAWTERGTLAWVFLNEDVATVEEAMRALGQEPEAQEAVR